MPEHPNAGLTRQPGEPFPCGERPEICQTALDRLPERPVGLVLPKLKTNQTEVEARQETSV